MNVKPGDMAIVVKSATGKNQGRIVEVISPLGESPWHNGYCWNPGDGFCWLVKFQSEVMALRPGRYLFAPVPDAWLRPVSGLEDEQHTEEDNKLEA